MEKRCLDTVTRICHSVHPNKLDSTTFHAFAAPSSASITLYTLNEYSIKVVLFRIKAILLFIVECEMCASEQQSLLGGKCWERWSSNCHLKMLERHSSSWPTLLFLMSDFTSNPDVDALFEDDPGPIDTIDDDDDDDLKLDDADTKVWLVKVIYPPFLTNYHVFSFARTHLHHAFVRYPSSLHKSGKRSIKTTSTLAAYESMSSKSIALRFVFWVYRLT